MLLKGLVVIVLVSHTIEVAFVHLSYRFHGVLQRLELLLVLVAISVDFSGIWLLIKHVLLRELKREHVARILGVTLANS